MARFHFLTLLLLIPTFIFGQDSEFIQTQATITEIETVVHAKRSVVTAKLAYVTEAGDSINSQTNLMHIPLLGSTKKVGDVITIKYQKDNPYVIESQEQTFMQAYGWYVIGAITLLYLFFRIRSKR